jgi:hypothetical protein
VRDGTLFGADDGSLWRAFSPPRWRIDRWLWFLFVKQDKAVLTVAGERVFAIRDLRILDRVPVLPRRALGGYRGSDRV